MALPLQANNVGFPVVGSSFLLWVQENEKNTAYTYRIVPVKPELLAQDIAEIFSELAYSRRKADGTVLREDT